MEAEVGELTASLFEEAHEMVKRANIKQLTAEKLLAEANGKIDVLTAEVAALKELVLTSTPSAPNHSLHPQLIDTGKKVSNSFFRGHKRSPSHNDIKRSNSLKGSAVTTGLPMAAVPIADKKGDTQRTEDQPSHTETIEIDPIVFDEFTRWKCTPNFTSSNSPFLQRVFTDDVSPCLQFTCLQLATQVHGAVEKNALTIEPIHGNNTFPRKCALSDEMRVCKYRMQLSNVDTTTWFYICKFARDRLAAVCDFFTYLRYIHQGLVKAETKEIYHEIVRLRKRMALARLGVLNLPMCDRGSESRCITDPGVTARVGSRQAATSNGLFEVRAGPNSEHDVRDMSHALGRYYHIDIVDLFLTCSHV